MALPFPFLGAERGRVGQSGGLGGGGGQGLGVALLEVVDAGADGVGDDADHEGEDEHPRHRRREPQQPPRTPRGRVRPCAPGRRGPRAGFAPALTPSRARHFLRSGADASRTRRLRSRSRRRLHGPRGPRGLLAAAPGAQESAFCGGGGGVGCGI